MATQHHPKQQPDSPAAAGNAARSGPQPGRRADPDPQTGLHADPRSSARTDTKPADSDALGMPSTVVLESSGASASSTPPTPPERDESVGATGGVPNDVVLQAHRDEQRGLEDTSRGAESNRTYDKLKKTS